MMHSYPFFQMLLHTLQYANLDCAVREMDTEEFGFEFSETLFIFDCLLPFSFDFFFFSLPAYFVFYTVVLGLKVFGTKVLRAMNIFAQMAEHIHIIAPQGNVFYLISVTNGNLIRLPIGFKCPCVVEKIAQMVYAACLDEGFHTAVGE